MTYHNFRLKVIKAKTRKKARIRNSYGTKQGWRWFKKNKWLGGEPVTEKQFGIIIRRVNEYLVQQLLEGHDVVFPHKMGKLELRKTPARIEFNNEELSTNLPIDWERTLKLWYEDAESYDNRTLIRKEYREIFRIVYNKTKANYNNKTFYKFTPHRNVKKALSEKIKNNEIDAFLRYEIYEHKYNNG